MHCCPSSLGFNMRAACLSSIFVCLALELGGLLYSCLPEQGKEGPLFFPLLFPGRSEAHLKYRGLTRTSSMQNWKVFHVLGQSPYFLAFKTCEVKALGLKSWKKPSWSSHGLLWRRYCWIPLPSLTNVQTTVQQHCPEQVVWTLGRRSRLGLGLH